MCYVGEGPVMIVVVVAWALNAYPIGLASLFRSR